MCVRPTWRCNFIAIACYLSLDSDWAPCFRAPPHPPDARGTAFRPHSPHPKRVSSLPPHHATPHRHATPRHKPGGEMGNGGSKGGLSKATLRLHAAIHAWDAAAVKAELRAGADVNVLRPVTREERFASWERGRAPRLDEVYGVTAVGMLLSEAYLALEAAEGAVEGGGGGCPLPFTGDLLADLLRELLAAGAGVNDVIEKFGVGAMTEGTVTALGALRRIVASAPVPRARTGRAGLLLPALTTLLQSGRLAAFPYDDLVVWADTHRADVVAAILAYGSVTLAVTGVGGALTTVVEPPLIAAIDRGNLPLARLLLEHGAPVDGADADGVTPLMHCAGSADPANADPDSDARRPTMALVELLLHAGAAPAARDGRRRTALHHFAGAKTALLDAAARRFVCLRLIREGLAVADRDAAGWSVLVHCMERKDTMLAGAMQVEERWLRRVAAVTAWSHAAGARAAAPQRATPVVVGRAVRRRSSEATRPNKGLAAAAAAAVAADGAPAR